MYRTLTAFAALALVAGCSDYDNVADAGPAASTPAAGAPDMASAPPKLDATSATGFVNEMARSDMYEVRAGKLAQTRGKTSQVKQFGAMMVNDHSATTEQLKAIVKKDNLSAPPTALDPTRRAMVDALDAAPANTFDRTYIDQQVKAHQEALNMLRTYAQSGTNADLKAFAAQTAPKVAQHLEKAQSMANAIASAGAPATGQ